MSISPKELSKSPWTNLVKFSDKPLVIKEPIRTYRNTYICAPSVEILSPIACRNLTVVATTGDLSIQSNLTALKVNLEGKKNGSIGNLNINGRGNITIYCNVFSTRFPNGTLTTHKNSIVKSNSVNWQAKNLKLNGLSISEDRFILPCCPSWFIPQCKEDIQHMKDYLPSSKNELKDCSSRFLTEYILSCCSKKEDLIEQGVELKINEKKSSCCNRVKFL